MFAWPHFIVTHVVPGVFELTYGARAVGRVWEDLGSKTHDDGDPLGALLGRSRATILSLLEVPMSTTEIARLLNQTPATTSRHLSVLKDSGLATSWRLGRSVLYRQTPLAASLTSVSDQVNGVAGG